MSWLAQRRVSGARHHSGDCPDRLRQRQSRRCRSRALGCKIQVQREIFPKGATFPNGFAAAAKAYSASIQSRFDSPAALTEAKRRAARDTTARERAYQRHGFTHARKNTKGARRGAHPCACRTPKTTSPRRSARAAAPQSALCRYWRGGGAAESRGTRVRRERHSALESQRRVGQAHHERRRRLVKWPFRSAQRCTETPVPRCGYRPSRSKKGTQNPEGPEVVEVEVAPGAR